MSKIAIAHDYFVQLGGAERVAEALHLIFPQAPVYTTVALPQGLPPALHTADIYTTWMQWMPDMERNFRRYFMLYPWAVEGLDLSGYELIISSSSGYAKGIRQGQDAVHVCYCHTPMRWVWRYEDYAARERFSKLTHSVLPLLLAGLRRWDLRAANQPDYYVANSHVVAERIRKLYGREAVVIQPPVDVNRFTLGDADEDYYLVLSRLVPYKKIDLAIEACSQLNRPLVVIGDGPDRARLESIAGPTVRFLGRQSDVEVNKYAAGCRALLFPGEEDFGITPLEINAAGRPVIAYRAGGATETVLEGETGLFFDDPTSDSLAATVKDFETHQWNRNVLRKHAESFGQDVFASRLLEFLSSIAPASCLNELATRTTSSACAKIHEVPSFAHT